MEASYLKAHPLWDRYPEWTPNLHSDRSQYSNLCARGSQGPQRASGSTVPPFSDVQVLTQRAHSTTGRRNMAQHFFEESCSSNGVKDNIGRQICVSHSKILNYLISDELVKHDS